MIIRRAIVFLAMSGIALAACSPKPAQPRGMFDLSNMPSSTRSSATDTTIPDHMHQNGGGSFSTGMGGAGGSGQMPGAPSGGF